MTQRRHFTELCALLAHTRDARMVFVEGLTDARILNRAFIDCGRPEIVAYSIDTVDFEGAQEVPQSNRGKCEWLSTLLSMQCRQSASGKAVVVIDADFDIYDGCLPSIDFLTCTEHCDLILYFAQTPVLQYFTVHIFGDDPALSTIFGQVVAVCKTLFAARRSLRDLDPTIGFVADASRACDIVDDRIVLDVERLIAQILAPRAAMSRSSELRDRITGFVFREGLPDTAQMSGHDFVRIFRYALIHFGRRRFSGSVPEVTVEAMLYGAQPAARLCATVLITTIFSQLCELSK